ncbi:MAG: hypothetical protein E7257_03195 [Lachnospiraceae bacterium]|nr:hypothetical protein [Lachnospiraceae bacterium]
MICESCKFDNREGALYCAECGKPLAAANTEAEKPEVKNADKTVILDEVVTNSKESVDNEDESEANTTVLTSDMIKPAQAAAPKGFTAGPTPVKPMAPMGPQGMAPTGQPVPQAPKMAPQQMAPMGQPAPQAPKMAPQQMAPAGQPAPQAPKMAPQQMAPAGQPAPQAPGMPPQNPAQPGPMTAPKVPVQEPKEEKPSKKDKKAAKAAKKAAKGKMGTGTKVYIVISIILILALGGALAWGYFIYHKGKMDQAKTDKETLIADYDAKISQKDSEIATLYASATDAQATITSLETQLADSQLAQAEAQAVADSYVSYDPLIDFVENCTADANTDMMVSDTVVYTTVGTTVEIYVYFPEDEGHLNYLSSDKSKADCEWGEDWINGNVLPLHIEALASGDITVEITNDQNDIKETIFVHIE